MATPSELARLRTELTNEQTEHLQRLLGSWSLLADLSFSDLLLVAPVASPSSMRRFLSGTCRFVTVTR